MVFLNEQSCNRTFSQISLNMLSWITCGWEIGYNFWITLKNKFRFLSNFNLSFSLSGFAVSFIFCLASSCTSKAFVNSMCCIQKVCLPVCIYPTLPAWAGCDTRSIFKSTTSFPYLKPVVITRVQSALLFTHS